MVIPPRLILALQVVENLDTSDTLALCVRKHTVGAEFGQKKSWTQQAVAKPDPRFHD